MGPGLQEEWEKWEEQVALEGEGGTQLEGIQSMVDIQVMELLLGSLQHGLLLALGSFGIGRPDMLPQPRNSHQQQHCMRAIKDSQSLKTPHLLLSRIPGAELV